ncbi:T9SS type B sorting domain-containing protein [Thalassobellus citreus]|uniref:T9SS type B sorting domain-containing protein n=1 Tax=Thalassobellus citreus TaxID=3367752 RepID=UPI0037A04463
MKKTTYVTKGIVFLLFITLFCSNYVFAQLPVPFSPRLPGGSIKVKGDIILIGNGIVTAKDLPLPYNGTEINNNNEGVYVNVASGGDPSIFSSSSADLAINNNCKNILYAGLYWASVYPLEVANNRSVQFEGTPRLEDWNQIKFKLPTGGFIDIVADNNPDPVGDEDDIIFDGYEYYGSGVENSFKDSPIICYKNVTSLLQGLPEADGEYTVANLRATRGIRRGGCSAGWTLVVIYESPILPSKFISVFDGYAGVQNTTELDIPVSGFQTLPSPLPVNSNIGVAALEGDIGISGDSFQFKASTSGTYTVLSDVINQSNNFFNSSITIDGAHVTNRNPASLNTLGLDVNNFRLPNPLNSVLPNNATAGDLKLTTNGDGYGVFLTSFAVEIIEPKITLTKVVEDPAGNDIGNQLVNLGDELNYVIGFQNTGNDDATNLIIRDILPINIDFNYPADMGLLPPGVTVQSYNPTTRELIFSVDNSVVEENDPVQEIRFKVTVVSSCSLLNDACSNIISNQAYVTYNGTINSTFVITDDPSFSANTGCLITPAATNFLADLNCVFEEEVILCGDNVVLTAGNGYDAYSWSTSPSGTPVIGTTQSITVTTPGTYYVSNTAIAPCQSTEQTFEVITFGANVTNPVIPFADQVVTCPNDGKLLPNIFLCGANDSRFIQTGITDTTSMIWEKLDETSCTAVINQDCANEDSGCTWNQVTTGPDFMADTAGQYRLTLNYTGGCFNQFYFNIYTNLLVPTATTKDIICTTPGEINVGGVSSGYEYSIDGINYQPTNVFSITSPGIYSVYVRQIGVTPNPCIFSVPDVQIRQRDFTVSTDVIQPFCNGGMGSVIVAANDARPQYYFSIYEGATLVNSVGPLVASDYTFSNLNPGIYTLNVSTEDGCLYTGDIEIINPPLIEATAALTKPLTCTDGEITVYPVGGTAPYFYFVNSATVFQTSPIISVTTTGVYDITVVDSNNCSADTSITVNTIPAPDFTVSKTDILCAEAVNSGSIDINVSNPNGNTLEYSIDNGVTFSTSPVFTGLSAGDYDVVVQYTFGPDVCLTTPQAITITVAPAINGTATLTTPYTCTTNGVITVSGVSGGTAPYTYSLDGVNFQPGLIFTGLTDGTYTVTIQDANNCSFVTAPVIIDSLNPPTDLDFTNTPISCPALTSDVTLTPTGGVTSLEYRIISPTTTSYQTSNVFTGLVSDTYTFEVRDANDCMYAESYTIEPLAAVTASIVITKDLDCTASPDGLITGNVLSGVAPFTYQVSLNGIGYGSSTSIAGTSFTHLAPTDGTYQFLITDANGCTFESGVQTINAISYPEISSISSTPNICNGDTNGTIQVTINNTVGTPPFIINVRNDTTGSNFGSQTSGLPSGDYTVTLTDSKSCTDTATVTIAAPDPINVVYHPEPITCDPIGGISKGSVVVDGVSGGTAPYNYFVTGTNGYFDSELNVSGSISTTFDVVDFGLYQINVVDANGCSVLIQDVLVASPPDHFDITVSSPPADCSTGGSALVAVGTALASAGPFHFAIYTGPGMIYTAPTAFPWQDEDAIGSKQTTFYNLIPGATYTFIVFDESTGCYYYETSTTPIPTNSTLTASTLISNNITCVGSADGNVSFDVTSIYPVSTNITYEVYNSQTLTPVGITGVGTVPANGTLNVSNFESLDFGNYFVLITEDVGATNAGCSVVSVPFNISESAFDLNISATVDKNANCNPNSGVINAIARDGTAPYLYQITTSATPPLDTDPSWASANVFNMDANSYYVHVKDAYGCIRSTPVLVLPSDPEPVITATLNNQCTVTEGNFEINVALTTAGIAPYSYSIDGGVFQTRTAPFSISNLASGTHTVEVQDANGCGNLVSVDIVAPIAIIPNVTTLPTCNDDDGEITVAGSGGTGFYSYSISPSPASISLSGNVFSGVPSGTYTVTITDTATLCSESVEVFLQAATLPSITITSPTAVTCFGDNNGTFEINVSGYSGSYTYEVFDSSSTSVFGVVSANTSTNPVLVSGLLADSYTVVINETASPFCSVTSGAVIISSPASILTVVASETSSVTCDDDKGTITAVASGDWGTYEYELTGAATVAYSSNGTFTNLSAGVYTVNVRDARSCIASDDVTLIIPDPIDAVVTANTTLLTCFGDTNASITASAVTGGQVGNYSFTLNMLSPTITSSGPQSSPVFTGLGVGTYNVVITDGYNCEFTSPDITIDQPTQVQAALVKVTSQTCSTGSTLELSATGGTGTYEYSATETFTTVLGSFSSSVVIPVSDGSYVYYVRDANGCNANVSNEITIDPLPTLEVDIDTTNAKINCAGDTTGVIVATAIGGLGSYVYTLQDDTGTNISPLNQNATGVFTDLPVGAYQVRVDSGDCLTASSVIPIIEPSLPLDVNFTVTNVTCTGANNGLLEIVATGGSGIIKYAISPQLNQFFESPIFENLASGNYQAIAQDESGCFVLFDFVINDPIPVSLSIVPNSIIPELCNGDDNGAFSIEISGGEMPYSVALDDINGIYTTGTLTQVQFDFTSLSGGDHIVYVSDALGCESEWNITFPESVLINPVVDVEYGCSNNLSTNTVTVSVDASITDLSNLSYSLDGGPYQTSNVFINVPQGLNHYIDVSHTNGCIKRTDFFDILGYDPLTLVLQDGELNQIVAVVSGGSGDYEFTLNGEPYGSENTFIIYASGDYTVTVTDRFGCVASATRYYEYIDVCIPNYFTPNDDGNLDEWGPGCTNQYKDLEFNIFDRYGRKIATLRVGEKWDGRYNGAELPTGDYWYVVKLNDTKDNRQFVGHFTLYR